MVSLSVDYAVFGLLIVGTFTFNIYSALSGPKQKTKADYVFANSGKKTVSMWIMLLSIARTFLGVRVFLGYPSELFYRGSEMWETMYGIMLAFPIVAYFFVPVYFSLGITSMYQYLDLRFKSRLVRCLASGTYIVRSTLNLGVTLFTPCIALKTVIGMPYAVSITGIAIIGIFFAVAGGLRSALMADVVQAMVMIMCTVIVIIQGTIEAKGPVNVVKTAYEGGRLNFFNFDLDVTKRVTTFTAIFGQIFISLSLFGCQQSFVQRYISMGTQKRASQTLWWNVPFTSILFSLSWVVGMVIYANYATCDPRSLGYISDIDEILPFYIEDKFDFLPGFLGLIMACLFNGTLSFFVSNLNSIAVVIYEDFVCWILPVDKITEKQQLYCMKLCAAVLGLIIIGIAFIVSQFSGVIESYMLMTSATSGPLLGAFILAMFIPAANWKGTSAGMIIAHIVTLWIAFGSFTVEKPPLKYLETSTAGCTNETFGPHIRPYHPDDITTVLPFLTSTILNDTDAAYDYLDLPGDNDKLDLDIQPAKTEDIVTLLFKMSYMYYALIGTFLTVSIGVIISYITGTSEEYRYSENLIHPFARKVCSWFPGEARCYAADGDKTKPVPTVSKKVDSSSSFKSSNSNDLCSQKVTTVNEKAPSVNDFPHIPSQASIEKCVDNLQL